MHEEPADKDERLRHEVGAPANSETILEPAAFYCSMYRLQVALRVRPMNKAEHKSGAKTIAHTLDNQVSG